MSNYEPKPYSHKIHGDLEDYLRKCENGSFSNMFFGPEHFFEIRDKRLIIPLLTMIRVNASPVPDIGYFVNSEFMLESNGRGEPNMSLVDAEKGVYDPKEALKDKIWYISDLNLWGG